MNIVFVHSIRISDQYQVLWRCKNIAKAIKKTGLHHAVLMDIHSFISNGEDCQRICDEADLIIIHLYDIGSVLKAALYWKARRKRVVLDLDEAVDLIPEDMEQHSFWKKGVPYHQFFLPQDAPARIEPLPVQQLAWAIPLMDAITVSSGRLAGDWQGYGQVCEVLDYIDFDQYLTTKLHQSDEIWIGTGGGQLSSHTFEQSGLINALEEICRQRPNVRLFLGNTPQELVQRMNIPRSQVVSYSWLPPEDWAIQLTNLNIGLALAATEYDFRCSRNRVLEYMAAKIPWIASDHLPYRELKEFGMVVENTKESWIQGLVSLIDSLETYQQKAEGKPYLYAVSQDINENIGKILDVYESILQE